MAIVQKIVPHLKNTGGGTRNCSTYSMEITALTSKFPSRGLRDTSIPSVSPELMMFGADSLCPRPKYLALGKLVFCSEIGGASFLFYIGVP